MPVRVSAAELVRESTLDDTGALLLIEAKHERLSLEAWVGTRREKLLIHLLEYGGILFRGFQVHSAESFGRVAATITPNLLDYIERAAPRNEVAPGVFTSTEFTGDQWIPLHHEMSYSHNWPQRIYFYCDLPPQVNGRTPVASERNFFPRLDPAIKRRFGEHGVMYLRNFGAGPDLSWRAAFQTDDRSQVEAYFRQCGIEWTWGDGDRLQTRQVRQATARHPETGETVWFNHAHMFHQSNMPAEIRSALIASFGSEGLPRNAYYGDGSPIEDSVVEEIRALYRECSASFPWQRGDVMLLDNFLMVHGREPFEGNRRILVAMADLFVNQEHVR